MRGRESMIIRKLKAHICLEIVYFYFELFILINVRKYERLLSIIFMSQKVARSEIYNFGWY
jgi:hypothetical protein